MAYQDGQGIIVQLKDSGGTYRTVSGLRTRDITLNSEMVDVTNADSSGRFREILDGAGIRSASFSGAGVFDSGEGHSALLDAWTNRQNRDFKFTVPGLGEFACTCKVTQLKYSGAHNGEVTADQTYESAGAVTFTAESA